MNKVYEEFGKFFLNVNVAIVVFVFVKPILENSFNEIFGLVFGFIVLLNLIAAYTLLKKAGEKNE